MKDNPDDKDILSKSQVAELLNVKPRSISELRAKGMPYFKLKERVFRYSRESILEWLESSRENKYY